LRTPEFDNTTMTSTSIEFFETQFRKQVANSNLALNPFEIAALPYLRGRVLDFGCGLGNLSVAAARRGCSVLALDAAPTAVQHLGELASQEGLAIEAVEADLRTYKIDQDFDAVVAIGLLMFFDCATARLQLAQLQDRVRPDGVAVINVLIKGTTYFDMFDPVDHCLFDRGELRERFAAWDIVRESFEDFPAPGGTVKSFVTLVARKAGATSA
jgi:tellurite methyltransferase